MGEVNDSKFNMWRACMAVIHVDGSVSKEELNWAQEKMTSLPFNETQLKRLKRDLLEGLSIETVLPSITHKPDLAFLLHLARTIGHLDGCFDEKERATFANLEKKILNDLELSSIEKEIHLMEERSNSAKLKVINKHSIFENVIENFKWWLNL